MQFIKSRTLIIKLISGKEYFDGKLASELTFDNKQYLNTLKHVGSTQITVYKWNKEGYLSSYGNSKNDTKYTYYFYKDGKL